MKGPAVADFETNFKQFLAAWNQHQELKSTGANLNSLFDSRVQLDMLRVETARSLR